MAAPGAMDGEAGCQPRRMWLPADHRRPQAENWALNRVWAQLEGEEGSRTRAGNPRQDRLGARGWLVGWAVPHQPSFTSGPTDPDGDPNPPKRPLRSPAVPEEPFRQRLAITVGSADSGPIGSAPQPTILFDRSSVLPCTWRQTAGPELQKGRAQLGLNRTDIPAKLGCPSGELLARECSNGTPR